MHKNIFTIFSTGLLGTLYYFSRIKRIYNVWLSTGVILFILSIVWFMNNGAIGSIPYIFILSLIILVLIAKRNQQNNILYIFLITIICLYALEYFFGDVLVYEYPSKQIYYKDMIFVFNLVLVSTFFVARYVKRSYEYERNKVNFQKGIIEEQNSQIYSSLEYASMVQRNIISDENDLKNLFTDYFVLFKPKDIVSGDFLWVHEKEHHGIVVVADCTGHGVPAAFLSILGISLLKEIINQEGVVNNAAILLEKLRKKLIVHLYNNEPGNHIEGIDMAVCIFNYPDYSLQFAGANRDLYLIRKKKLEIQTPFNAFQSDDKHCLYTFKATKNTIGFDYETLAFRKFELEFYTGDTFYLFTDGFPDQLDFNGKKKIGMSRFRNEILNMQAMPLAMQEDHLFKMNLEWKGEKQQTDDILVIGVRL